MYLSLGRLLISLGRDAEAIEWLERGINVFNTWTATQIADREPWDYVLEDTRLTLGLRMP